MLKPLLKKEFLLALHPTFYIYLMFIFFVFIPNYPYEVIFFFISLSIFFICQQGRENKDLTFTCPLPVKKREVALARIVMCVILQVLQVVLLCLLIFIKSFIDAPVNQAGLEANIALVGVGLIILSIFNIIFFPMYFKNPNKIGKPFLLASIANFLFIFVIVALCFASPIFATYIDTPDPIYIGYKLIVLGIGIVLYIALTILSAYLSMKNFEKVDL